MLSSKQIEIFYEVYKNSSMTAAANKLQISQPSISKTLKSIESNLGFKLFIRQGKKITPTDEGKELYEYASIVTNQLKNFNYIANTFRSKSLDYINIGTTPSLGETLVPDLIIEYSKIKPESRFNLINLNSIDLIEDRYKPDIDMTICYNAQPISDSRNIIIAKGKHYLISPKKYNLDKNIFLNDIAQYPYIEITNLLSIYSGSSIISYFIDNNIEVNFQLKSDSYSSALSIVSGGYGVSIVDEYTANKANKALVNKSNILDTDFTYRINAMVKKEVTRSECNDFFNFLYKYVWLICLSC